MTMRLKTSKAVCLGLLLAACSTTQQQTAPQLAPFVSGARVIGEYRYLVDVRANHTEMAQAFRSAVASPYVFTQDAGVAQFQLSLTGGYRSAVRGPRLMGRLSRTTQQHTYVLHYALMDWQGKVMVEGDVQHALPETDGIYPSSAHVGALDAAAAQVLAQQVLASIEPFMTAAPWHIPVMSQIDDMHVSIAAGQDAGVVVMDVLKTVTHPIATLQVAAFETLPNGSTRTVLRLLDGPIPQAGRLLERASTH